jgi:thiamine biosynthesis protein ThiS
VITDVMQIVLNGNETTLPSAMTLAQLLEHVGVDRRLVALAYNGEVIPRDQHEQVRVQDGDAVEIVRMVGGG